MTCFIWVFFLVQSPRMKTQKYMYVIAIVLSMVFSAPVVSFAEDTAQQNSGTLNASVNINEVMRNDVLVSDEENQKNNSSDVESEHKEVITSAPFEVGTGDSLSRAVDGLISGTLEAGITTDSASFCDSLNQSLMKQSDELRASLAWNAESYKQNIDLRASGDTESQKALHEQARNAYKDGSTLLKTLAPSSTKESDSIMLSRFQALSRSSLVEMTIALKDKNANAERIDKLSKLLDGSLSCVEKYSGASEENTKNLETIKSSLQGVISSWNENKPSFGVAPEKAKEAFVLKVKTEDVVDINEETIPASSDKVSSSDDLKAFSARIIKTDDRVREVAFDDSSASLRYATRGKFLGFIPVWISPKVVVNSKGEVEVDYPWYSGLSSKKVKVSAEEVKLALEEVGLVAKDQPVTDTPVEMSMQYRARAIEAMSAFLKIKIETPLKEDSSEVTPAPAEEVPASDSQA